MGNSDENMGIEELSEIYRVEKKSATLTNVRPDLYPAIAELLKAQRREYDEQLRVDPESINTEGANIRRKKGDTLSRDIVEMRMGKICKMALRGAMGETHSLVALTAEEKPYYDAILALSKNHKALLARMSGNMRYANAKIIPFPAETPESLQPVKGEFPEPEEVVPIPTEEPIAIPEEEVMDVPPEEFAPMDGEFEMEETEQDIPEDELDSMVPQEKSKPQAVAPIDDDLCTVRILETLPTPIAGPERNYVLVKEQIVRMPNEFAQALINRGLAAKISTSA
ncbi:MAG: hypothetical protein J5707_02245 [Candidatus Methanomethylophilus sp.]|nr:hypothetical protein [Methanomethylophilus sp.]